MFRNRIHFTLLLLIAGIFSWLPLSINATAPDGGIRVSSGDQWITFPYVAPAVNNDVLAVAVDGQDVYVGGLFTEAGSAPAGHIARWDGSAWHTLGSGLNGAVHAIHIHAGQLYAGGTFTQAGGQPASRIARWDGENWHTVGSGFNNTVRAVAATGSGLYAGGQFTESDGQSGYFLSFWDGETWSDVGGGTAGQVLALAAMGDDLIAAGEFTFAGGEAMNRIARWDGENWHTLAGGADGPVNTLLADGSDLYIGGSFSRVDGTISAAKAARWDGSQWHTFPTGISGGGITAVNAMAKMNGQLCIAGNFSTASSLRVNNLACWNGTSWTGSGNGTNRPVLAMQAYGTGLVLGGSFTTGSHHVTIWDAGDWQPMNSGQASGLMGLNGYIRSMVEMDGNLYVAGRISGAGGLMANSIARWDGSSWSALGEGMDLEIAALAVYNGDLHAAGEFRFAGGNTISGIARWDGEEWHAVGSSSPLGGVFAMTVWRDDLYIGGSFRNFGGIVYNKIARWDGGNWHTLAGGVDPDQFAFGAVHTLLGTDDHLYVGGSFTVAGGEPANRLARWDGGAWQAVASEINQTVFALAEWDGYLYAGGQFTIPGSYIARLKDGVWDEPGSGMNNQVFGLYPAGDVLYAGGIFTTAGGDPALRAAVWNGTDWSAPGSGFNGRVNDFILYNERLYIGGVFTEAGGQPSNFFAALGSPEGNVPDQVLPAEPANGATGVDPRAVLSWNPVDGATSYDLEIATDAGFTTIISPVTGITGTSVNYSTDPLPPLTQLWWRVRANINGTSGEWSEGWTFTTSTLTSLPGHPELPRQLTLEQNYPNPFNPATVIRFGLPEQGDVRLGVFSLTGQRVARLAEGNHTGGWHQVVFDASALSSGVYFYRLQTQAGTITRKLTLIK
jgi:trimeric autotransporter adhesin